MELSIQVKQVLEKAELSVVSDSKHNLEPFQRQQIYRTIAWDPNGEEILKQLSIITAQQVLPLWQQVWPHIAVPEHALNAAREMLAGNLDHEAADTIADRAWRFLEQMNLKSAMVQESSDKAFYAGEAAVEALFRVIGLDRWADTTITEDDTDADFDPWSSDTALWAASAYAGAVWEKTSSSGKRLEFWTWWLNEAIPRAWSTVHRPQGGGEGR